jgi:hypothetical protein
MKEKPKMSGKGVHKLTTLRVAEGYAEQSFPPFIEDKDAWHYIATDLAN